MGKTEKGALWLDATKTTPYDFYQYWRNIEDDSVENVLKMLTFLPMEKIRKRAKGYKLEISLDIFSCARIGKLYCNQLCEFSIF